jgi:hypothetical protein
MGEQRIILHAHCRNCAPQKPRSKSMSDWARVECGVTNTGFQVWCKRCDMEDTHLWAPAQAWLALPAVKAATK